MNVWQGPKWWYVCGNGGSLGRETCYEEVLDEGDVLFYPRDWYHQTQNLGEPVTITLTGTVVNAFNYKQIAGQLHKECTRGSLGFDLSGPLCDAVQECVGHWHERWREEGSPASLSDVWPAWRAMSSKATVAKRDSLSSLGNNYDGRNPISG